jgi:ribosome biogenesis GTPase
MSGHDMIAVDTEDGTVQPARTGAARAGEGQMLTGEVVKLDRGFPLVRLDDGRTIRCQHATALVKNASVRAVVGDRVQVSLTEGADMAQIGAIGPRGHVLVRKDPAERTLPQTLAANFDAIIVAQPLAQLNLHRLERELVLAFETGAQVLVILTKADLAESEDQVRHVRDAVDAIAGDRVHVLVVSEDDAASVEAVRRAIGTRTAVLMGRSGVGKSSLVNVLVGRQVQATNAVRSRDGKGRHTTVSREIVDLPGGGRVIDMPGVRGLALWDAGAGIAAAFADIVALAEGCRFRDCRHGDEPGCAVRKAVEEGALSQARLDAYRDLAAENEKGREKREEAARKRERRGHPRRRG